jgi:hypothetical protein
MTNFEFRNIRRCVHTAYIMRLSIRHLRATPLKAQYGPQIIDNQYGNIIPIRIFEVSNQNNRVPNDTVILEYQNYFRLKKSKILILLKVYFQDNGEDFKSK